MPLSKDPSQFTDAQIDGLQIKDLTTIINERTKKEKDKDGKEIDKKDEYVEFKLKVLRRQNKQMTTIPEDPELSNGRRQTDKTQDGANQSKVSFKSEVDVQKPRNNTEINKKSKNDMTIPEGNSVVIEAPPQKVV